MRSPKQETKEHGKATGIPVGPPNGQLSYYPKVIKRASIGSKVFSR